MPRQTLLGVMSTIIVRMMFSRDKEVALLQQEKNWSVLVFKLQPDHDCRSNQYSKERASFISGTEAGQAFCQNFRGTMQEWHLLPKPHAS